MNLLQTILWFLLLSGGGGSSGQEGGDKELTEGKVVFTTWDEYNALEEYDDDTLYVMTMDAVVIPTSSNSAYQSEPPTSIVSTYDTAETIQMFWGYFRPVEITDGERIIRFYTYDDAELDRFSDVWELTTEEEYAKIQADEDLRERWPFASLEDEIEARNKVRLEGIGMTFGSTINDAPIITIENSASQAFKLVIQDGEVKKRDVKTSLVSEFTLPRAMTRTDTLTIDGVAKEAYITDESGKKTGVSDLFDWEKIKTFPGVTGICFEAGGGNFSAKVKISAETSKMNKARQEYQAFSGFLTLYLE